LGELELELELKLWRKLDRGEAGDPSEAGEAGLDCFGLMGVFILVLDEKCWF